MDDQIAVYILSGGQSSRFGSDKARALVDGTPLLLRVAGMLGDPRRTTVVARSSEAYQDLGLRTIDDRRPGLGPLGGLEAALLDRQAGWLLLAACDTLGVSPAWLDLLAGARSVGALAVAFRGQHWEPMPALYHTDLLAAVRSRLELDPRARSLAALLTAVGATVVPTPEGWAAIRSINTRTDLAR
jgi:molybdopterin-guanine dinucleotide biosynthesis protein A